MDTKPKPMRQKPNSIADTHTPSDSYELIVRVILEGLVVHPADLQVTVNDHHTGTTVMARPRSEDAGRLIGKAARTVQAMQVILKAISGRRGEFVRFLVDTSGLPRSGALNEAFQPNPNWDSDEDAFWVLRYMADLALGEGIPITTKSVNKRTTFALIPQNPATGGVVAALDAIMMAWGRNNGRIISVECENCAFEPIEPSNPSS